MDESKQRFELLRARYAASFADKLHALDGVWRAFLAEPADAAVRRELQQQLHRLSGSAPAYGYAALGALARAADNAMHAWPTASSPADEQPVQLAASMRRMLDELAQMAARAQAREQHAPGRLRVLVLEDEGIAAQYRPHVACLEANACVVRCEREADRLRETLLIWPCHAFVFDFWRRDDGTGDIVAMLRGEPGFAGVARICLSERRDAALLRTAIDAGCDAALSCSDDPELLLSAVRGRFG